MLLGKYMGEIDGSGEMDLILTDEDSCQLVCGLWLVHCQEKGKTFTVIGKEKIVRRVREQKEEEQNEEKGHESNDLNESSDDIVCEDSD